MFNKYLIPAVAAAALVGFVSSGAFAGDAFDADSDIDYETLESEVVVQPSGSSEQAGLPASLQDLLNIN